MSVKTKALNEKLSHVAAAQPVKIPETPRRAPSRISKPKKRMELN